jgi:hypothetical protein
MSSPRIFVAPSFKVRCYDWSKRLRKRAAKKPWKGMTWASGTRINMRFQQLLGIYDGLICGPEVPGAELFLLFAIRKNKNTRHNSWRYILTDGEIYHDVTMDYENIDPQQQLVPWETQRWIITPKSKRHHLTTEHQIIIKEAMPWVYSNLLSVEANND